MTAPAIDMASWSRRWRPAMLRGRPWALAAVAFLVAIAAASGLAPLLAPHDPGDIDPALRLQPPGAGFALGTDAYGRDLLSRLLYGGRVSLSIGGGAAVIGVAGGLAFGLLAGFFHRLDGAIMRAMDGLMAIPSILLAVAVVALWGGHPGTVLLAIAVPEVPLVTRLVRSIVLAARAEPYVEAARALGTAPARILWRHVMPRTFGPLTVQATYICASAMLLESMLSFLGAGVDPDIPTWGNIMAEGRLYLQIRPGTILWPGLMLSLTILAINVLGDCGRDRFDPRREGAGP